MNDLYGAAALAVVAGLMLAWGIAVELRRNRQARRRIARRHPSVRFQPDYTSDAARRYHESSQWGR